MNIYDQYQSAFKSVAAFIVMKDGERVATVAFKFPRDGAGRLYAYTHFIGQPMTRGWASGFGYDKRTPAVRAGFHEAAKASPEAAAFAALFSDGGEYWDDQLRKAGYVVHQTV